MVALVRDEKVLGGPLRWELTCIALHLLAKQKGKHMPLEDIAGAAGASPTTPSSPLSLLPSISLLLRSRVWVAGAACFHGVALLLASPPSSFIQGLA